MLGQQTIRPITVLHRATKDIGVGVFSTKYVYSSKCSRNSERPTPIPGIIRSELPEQKSLRGHGVGSTIAIDIANLVLRQNPTDFGALEIIYFYS